MPHLSYSAYSIEDKHKVLIFEIKLYWVIFNFKLKTLVINSQLNENDCSLIYLIDKALNNKQSPDISFKNH